MRLLLRPGSNEQRTGHAHTERAFNDFERPFFNRVKPGKLLADLLKRQAAQVMRDVTECPADTIPANIMRLDCIRDVLRLVVSHGLAPADECRISGCQLTHPCTCRDFLEVLAITRQQHRSPCGSALPCPQLDRIDKNIQTLAQWILSYSAQGSDDV